ncbi:gastrin/cholecystokinin type B receptor-like [Lytechinus variegatus]|uniref:gastrin/cholecystokinin type B receptor-like n=1 Tax=Lytechinus variegatus TaxID=7654 RepID=UPI001BB1BF63|nr:gastrin/cholecystokinin type B receptor-like [Lytechinus variegatus]
MVTDGWLWVPIKWNWWMKIQMATAVVGILGNLLVIVLLFQRRKKSRATDTLIGALATADFVTSIFMIPLPTAERVPMTILGEVYCRLIFSKFLLFSSSAASIMALTSIAIERYIAVVHPLRCKELLSRRRIRTAIVLTWILGVTLYTPLLYTNFRNPQQECEWGFPSREIQILIGVGLFSTQFLIPMIVSLTVHGLTARTLHRKANLYLGENKNPDANPSLRHVIAKKRVLQTLFLVIMFFIICWGPIQTGYMLFDLGIIPVTFVGSTIQHVFIILALWNSCANPFIYAIRYPEFRKAIRELFNPNRNDASLFGDRGVNSSPFRTNVL